MTRKLDEWKFKKNTTSAERRSYVQEGGRPRNPPRDGTSGVKVTPAKLERWKKSIAKEVTGGRTGSMNYRSMSTGKPSFTVKFLNIFNMLCRWIYTRNLELI